MDADAHRVTRAGEVVHLSPTEYKLLHYLLVNTGRVRVQPQILDHVWQYDFDGEPRSSTRTSATSGARSTTVEPKLIHTVRGVGYCLRDSP